MHRSATRCVAKNALRELLETITSTSDPISRVLSIGGIVYRDRLIHLHKAALVGWLRSPGLLCPNFAGSDAYIAS